MLHDVEPFAHSVMWCMTSNGGRRAQEVAHVNTIDRKTLLTSKNMTSTLEGLNSRFRVPGQINHALAARNYHANTARTHDQCTAVSTATLTSLNDVAKGTSVPCRERPWPPHAARELWPEAQYSAVEEVQQLPPLLRKPEPITALDLLRSYQPLLPTWARIVAARTATPSALLQRVATHSDRNGRYEALAALQGCAAS